MPDIPRHFSLMLQALSFRDPRPETLRTLTGSEWDDLFSNFEYARLLIPLSQASASDLPHQIQSRMARNVSDNAERFERIKTDYLAIAGALRNAGAEHLVLKGFALCPDFVDHPRFRMQSDIDLFCPAESLPRGRDAVLSLGYKPYASADYSPGHHLAPLRRETDWKWNGNLFDPNMPASVELHFQFSDETLVRLGPKGLERFWDRRVEQSFEGFHFPSLLLADHFGYCALHIVRHLLEGLVPVYNVYELARFLHRNTGNCGLWKDWHDSHDGSIRSLQAIGCYLARDWFACDLPEEIQKEIQALPAATRVWLQMFSRSPLAASFSPNKDALWLHSTLVSSSRDRRSVLFTGLLPTKIPDYRADHYVEYIIRDGAAAHQESLQNRANYVSHVVSRTAYHVRILLPTLWRGVRFWWGTTELGAPFWTYFAASFAFDFGMFIFFFLFNLFLLDCGYRENFVGLVTSVSAVGGIAGTIAGGVMAQRFGLRRTLLFCFAFVPLVSIFRLLLISRFPQLGLAFLSSMVGAISAVCYSPALADVTNMRNRAFTFSFVGATLIGIGFLAGLVGGNLPGWVGRLEPSAALVHQNQVALLVACGISAIALWPASHLRFTSVPAKVHKLYPRNPFLLRYLPAVAVWALVTGSFSPFFNVYFAQYLRMPVNRIGVVFSFSYVTQVVAILATPVIFRKFGLVTGIMYMQIATALSLGLLATAPGARSAAIIYTGFMAFQWMSEPGMETLLMNEISPTERSGASALNLLVISSAQAVVAVIAGASFARFGYPPVLAAIGIVALISAVLFRGLLGGSKQKSGVNIGETGSSGSISPARAETTTN